MAWQITFEKDDGEQAVVSLDDLSPDVFEEIAKGTELTFWGVYQFPKEHPEVLYAVICAAAEHAGVVPPPKAETMRAAYEQAEMLSPATAVSEMPMVDGFPPVPSETEVGSTSTSLGLPTTGLEPSLEPSPSDGS